MQALWSGVLVFESPGSRHQTGECMSLQMMPAPAVEPLSSFSPDIVEQRQATPEFLTHKINEHNKMVALSHESIGNSVVQ